MLELQFPDDTEGIGLLANSVADQSGRNLTYYQRNKDKINAQRRQNRAENKNGAQERLRAQKVRAWQKNRDKELEKSKVRYQREKDERASKRLKKDFGITLDEYNAMFEMQKGLCAVCGEPQKIRDKYGNLRRFSVDHHHKTGRVRQLLCGPCNLSIGLVKENVVTLNSMIDYIKRHEEGKMKRVSVEFTLDEIQALAGLIDAGVKSVGIQGVKAAALLIDKLEKAVAEANAPKQEAE
jgi:hypothetical protein